MKTMKEMLAELRGLPEVDNIFDALDAERKKDKQIERLGFLLSNYISADDSEFDDFSFISIVFDRWEDDRKCTK